VRLAYHFATENDLVRADAIESTEFRELVGTYLIYAVPKTVVHETYSLEGAVSEDAFTEALFSTLTFAKGAELAAGEDLSP